MFKKRTLKILGETSEMKCDKCGNTRKFKYVSEKFWISFLSFPIYPYKEKKVLVCPVCSMGREIKGDIELTYTKGKSLSEIENENKLKYDKLKKKFEDGEISKNEFIRITNVLKFD